MKHSFRALALVIGTGVVVCAFAQGKVDPLTAEGYILPPKDIMDAAVAPWYKNVTVAGLNPTRDRFIVVDRDGPTSIASLGRAHVNLGGMQVDTKAQRDRAINARTAKGFHIQSLKDGSTVEIKIPMGARISDPTWSPDGASIAFLAHFDNGSFLYLADPNSGASHELTKKPLKLTMETNYVWVDGGRKIVAPVIPDGMVEAPVATVASSPRVQQTDQRAKRIRAFPSLLASPFEKTLLEFYATSQLATIDVATGKVTPVGKPAMIRTVNPSPDGKYFIVTTLTKPFSYVVPVSSFGSREAIWDETGAERALLQNRPMTLSEPQDPTTPPAGGAGGRRGGAGANGRRNLAWRPDGSGLSFLQIEPAAVPKDGEDAPPTLAKRKDRVMLWTAPFGTKDQKVVFATEDSITAVRYGAGAKAMFIDVTADTKAKTLYVPMADVTKPVTLLEPKTDGLEAREDLLTTTGSNGLSIVRTDRAGTTAYITGIRQAKDATKEGPKPFIEAVDLATQKRTPIFEGRADVFESASLLDDDAKQLLVTRQTAVQPPNTFLVDRVTNAEKAVTKNVDYAPDLTALRRETIIVTRADGMKFQVKVTFPRIATYGVRLPGFFWFYPAEFTSQEAYDKSKRPTNKNLFAMVTGANKAILCRAGYVLVEPDCPIVGPAGKMNDEYIPQLRANLLAVIDELDRRGWIDRNRLGIGGHSYGAFSTANALANTPYFKAGIAGDGCYNRTLTPFGFQTEQRQIWEDRELYLDMSPILKAEQMTGALLMYHGMEDQNVGTAPINSERMYASMEALGKPAALYMYPYEDHGQIARETVLDQWARFVAWLDKWVKNPPAVVFPYLKEPVAPATGPGQGRGGAGGRTGRPTARPAARP